jgi:REP element-mobilizing transposase RayT
MARPLRIEFPGALYHVMSHGVAGTPTFTDDLERCHILDSLQEMVEIGKLIIYCFVLMTNHFHLLCETPQAGLSRCMKKLLGKYAQWFNHRHNRHGHLWQARYKALLVEDGQYFLDCTRYIHLNPVKAKMCASPEDYAWSSYGSYFGSGRQYDWISKSRTLGYFPGESDYTRFILQGLQGELKNPFEEAVGGILFGSKAFVDRMSNLFPIIKEIGLLEPCEPKSRQVPSIKDINYAIDQVFPSLSECQRTRMFVYCMRRFTEMPGKDIAAVSDRSQSAVTHIWESMQTQLLMNPDLQQKMIALTIFLSKTPTITQLI